MAKLGDLVVRIGADTRDLNKSLGKVQRNMRSMTSNFTKLGRSMTKSFTLPLALIGGASLKVAVDFEASMAKVKAVSGATAKEFDLLAASAKELGRTTVFTASEVAGLQLEFAKLGFTAVQINDATEATLNLAQATGTDLAQAAEVAGATLGGFGLAASETGRVADVMAAAFSSSALDIENFQESMKHVAPNAKAAGVSIEEASAMLAVLSKAGIKGGIAGTALRRILQEMQGTSGTLTERFAELSAQGIGLTGAMDEVGRRAGTSLLVLAEGAGEVQSLTDSYKVSEGAAKAMADVMNDTTAGAMKRMTSALEGAAIVIGDALAPTLNSLATIITDLASSFSDLSKNTQQNIIATAGLVAALGPLLIMIPKIIAMLSFIGAPIALAVVAFGTLALVIKDVIKLNSEALTTVQKANRSVTEQTTEVRHLVKAYKDSNISLKDKERILKRLEKLDGEHFKNLTTEKTTYEDLVKNLDLYTAALRRSYLEKAYQKKGEDLFKQLADNEARLLVEMEKSAKRKEKLERGDFWLGDHGDVKGAKVRINKTLALIEAFEADKQKILEKYASTAEIISGGEDEGLVIIRPKQMELLEALPVKLIAVKKPLKELQESTVNLGGSIKTLSDKTIVLAEAFGNAFGEMAAGAKTGAEAFKSFAINSIRSIIAIAKANVIANATSPTNPANIASGGLAAPAFALAGLSALDALLANIPALAEGGLAYGPTLAMVGDNRGANVDPEVVAPLSKLKDMLGGNAIQVYGRISGDDIVISNNRASRDRNRF